MKNWKRRFFVLTEISLGYYKTIEVSIYLRMGGWGGVGGGRCLQSMLFIMASIDK